MKSRLLRISVTFLTGRYHGTEWPPSPARLYQALVAANSNCGYRNHETENIESALRWLETQDPPHITTCRYSETHPYWIAVPNNDTDVIAREWAAGKPADPSKLRTLKEVKPREMKGPGPHVQYVWYAEPDSLDEVIHSLRALVNKLHTLGWGIDMAFAELEGPAQSGTTYRPTVSGPSLTVPMTGTLDDLRRTYGRFVKRTTGLGVDTYTQPSILQLQSYRRDGDYNPPSQPFVLMKLDSDLARTVPWQDCMKVAGWLRHAAAETLAGEYPSDFINEYVMGHTENSSKSRRLSYVPLPSIYGRYADGQIRRALLIEPPDSDGELSKLLGLKLPGQIILGKNSQAECVLAPSDREDWVINLYAPKSGKRLWRSVTPVVLHGRNAARSGSISISKTERLLLRAFEMAGIDESQIESLSFQSAPLWPGARHAASMLVPAHLTGYPRLHVQVGFREHVRGPVLAGIGRHYGIGTFAWAEV